MSRKVKSLYNKLLMKSDFGCDKSCWSVNFTQLLVTGTLPENSILKINLRFFPILVEVWRMAH